MLNGDVTVLQREWGGTERLKELGRTLMPGSHPECTERRLRTSPRPDESRRPTLNRHRQDFRTPRSKLLPQLEVIVIEDGPTQIRQFADKREILDVGRDDDREGAGRVTVFSRFAVTGTTIREGEEVLDAFDCVRVVLDDGFAVVDLVQESTLGSTSATRNVDGEERVSVTEEMGDDVPCEFVNRSVEVKVSAVREEGRMVARVEVSRRVESCGVFGAMKRGIDAEEVVVGIDTRTTDTVDRSVVFRLLDETGFCRRVVVESRDETMSRYSSRR